MARTRSGETRTAEQLREHYEIERDLASRLRRGAPEERLRLYAATYEELFRRVTHHPILQRKGDPEITRRNIVAQYRRIRRFLRPDTHFLEIGPGDCSLSLSVAREVSQVTAVDVTELINTSAPRPSNFRFIRSDGIDIPVPPETVTVAFSNQLMEHLHPDDALVQLRNVYRALGPGGVYVCLTPNALSGPHDISMYFDEVATGFHLKEYTNAELSSLFGSVGFSRVRAMVSMKGHSILVPVRICRITEWLVRRLPRRLRRGLGGRLPLRLLLGVQLVGYKE
jgi:SAM-dependent methyltransferase